MAGFLALGDYRPIYPGVHHGVVWWGGCHQPPVAGSACLTHSVKTSAALYVLVEISAGVVIRGARARRQELGPAVAALRVVHSSSCGYLAAVGHGAISQEDLVEEHLRRCSLALGC
jgi:hypothetical protein